ncbi:MAG TPA: hypothetical protein ENJ25_02730 [Firmicutes bacterium]|jgi:UDP-N-acetylglucosamine acyltransferase|uniref:UDP N-acetylglucosamine O-acyltransferase C-terminal domain-containing protein n=1 Tax=candidate division TA06 bacterium TaxID=2250710 RepID=A0A660S8Y6_UNCT6|nr:MAG: hypothetical protein DRP44_05865 [candidate division TA06 bacterium]HFD05041.1 hypothetical protein [Bacillota bacterium]
MQTIGENFKKGDYCKIGDNVLIGDNVILGNGIVIYDDVIIGSDVFIADYSIIGLPANREKENGGGLIIGDGVEIYPYTLIQFGKGDKKTKIESEVRILGHSTIGYNSEIKRGAIVATGTIIGHDVNLGDSAIVNARSYLKTGVSVGKLAHIATIASIEYDVLPFSTVKGIPPYVENVNIAGLKKYGYREEEIEIIMRAFEIVFKEGLTVSQAIENLVSKMEKKAVIEEIKEFLEKVKNTGRGLVK